tara:strand:+ start:2507 stop:3115 length:609 start_codon:yes stop_codon:yes gene_type:complete
MLKPQKTEGLEAGTDEAGRGCLAGPVTAAAVILPPDINLPTLNDSKKLSAKYREQLRAEIEAIALYFGVAHVHPKKIDEINILNASIVAMHLALGKLKEKPDYILVDGNRFHSYKKIPSECIIKGDGKFQNIAAASILAKTYRDEYMRRIDHEFPQYQWKQNKGYPTKKHREAIRKFGVCSHHRKSFQLLQKQFEFPFSSRV